MSSITTRPTLNAKRVTTARNFTFCLQSKNDTVGLQYSLLIFKIVFSVHYFAHIWQFLISRPPLPSTSLHLLLHRQIIYWINWSVIKQFDGNICTQCVCGPSGNLVAFAFHNQLGPKKGKACQYSEQIYSPFPTIFLNFRKVACPCICSDACRWTFEDAVENDQRHEWVPILATECLWDIHWQWQVLAPK